MADQAHESTEKLLKELEGKLTAEYTQATKDVQDKLEDYLRRFEVKNRIKLEQVAQGKITQEEYNRWHVGQVCMGQRWKEMKDTLAEDLTNANQIAMSMVNGYTPEAYAINHNFGTYEAEKGSLLDTSYTLYDRHTVENLVKNNPDLLPKPGVDIPKDQQWNKQKVNSAVLQGVLQGESIPQIAKRIQQVTDMNRRAAIRSARTAITGAQNAGRIDSYRRVKEMGINIKKVWLATLDGRTRHTHRDVDGEKLEVGDSDKREPTFSNGCRYPGDPRGHPSEVYNCRCTLIGEVEDVDYDLANTKARNNYKLGGISYDEWKKGHETGEYGKLTPGVVLQEPIKGMPTLSSILSDPTQPEMPHFVNIRKQLGDEFVNGMETVLNFTEEEDVKDIFYKYAEDLKVIDTDLSGGAYFSPRDRGIHINANNVMKGDEISTPYQTVFHEFGHNIDFLAGGKNMWEYASNTHNDGELIKNIRKDWKDFKRSMIKKDMLSRGPDSVLAMVDRTGTKRAFGLMDKYDAGKLTLEQLIDGLGQNEWNKIDKVVYTDTNRYVIDMLKQEGMDYLESGNISDIIEGCTHISYPLGIGHGSSYHDGISTAKEFFAEVLDSKAVNPQSLAQMRRIFPNGVKTVEDIIRKVTGK